MVNVTPQSEPPTPLTRRDELALGSKPAPGELAFVQGFVNTTDLESGRDDLATPEGLAAWLVRHGLLERGEPVPEEARARAVAFREAVRALLLAHNGHPLDTEKLPALQVVAEATPLRLRWDGAGRGELEPLGGGPDAGLGHLQAVIYRAMRDGTWERLKACLSDTCGWAFYDASRNRSGTWCSMEVCGNRTKVRAHRRRQAREGA